MDAPGPIPDAPGRLRLRPGPEPEEGCRPSAPAPGNPFFKGVLPYPVLSLPSGRASSRLVRVHGYPELCEGYPKLSRG